MSNFSIGLVIGAAVSSQFTTTANRVTRDLRLIGETAGKLSQRQIRLDALGRAESDLEKARAKAAAASRAVMDLRKELQQGPPRKDWARDFEKAQAASERAARGVEHARESLTRADTAFRTAGGAAGGYAANMRRVGSEIEQVQAKQARLNQYLESKNTMSEWASSARTAVLRGGLAVAAVSRGIIAPAMNFETAMVGVAKQVEGARDANGNLTQTYYDMRAQIQQLGRELPLTTNEIADMVTAGARMSVPKDQLIDFTKTSAKMAAAFELPAGELADSMGKIAGLFKIPIPAIGDLADTINYLDDNAISKGGDIISFMTRTGGVASGVKVTGKEMAALGSTLLTLGERTETAGTATNAIFQKLAAAESGSKKLKGALKGLGLSASEVQKGMQKDAMGTLMKVMDVIGKLPADKQMGIMVDLVGLEHSDTMAKLANNTQELRRQLDLATGDAAKGSMQREFDALMKTSGAQWQTFKNQLGETVTNIGTALLPSVISLFKTMGEAANVVADFARNNQTLIKTIAGAAAGLLAWKTVGSPLIGMIGSIKSAWTVLSFAVTSNPIGLILMGIAVAAGAIMANWDTIGPWISGLWASVTATTKAAWGEVTGFFSGAWTQIQTAFSGGIGGITTLLVNWSPVGLIYQGISAALSSLGIELPGKFSELGSMLITGLVNGITGMGSAVKGAIGEVADSTIGWFKEKLGIKSPSRVFLGLGQMVGEGAAQGIGSTAGAVGRATAGLGLAATMAFQPAMATAVPQAAMAEHQIDQAGTAAGAGAMASQVQAPSITQTFEFHITQQAGENGEALARRVAELVQRQNQSARRAALGDWA